MSTEPTANNRLETIEALLDAALSQVSKQIAKGSCSASLLREIVQLASAAGISLAEGGQSTSPSFDSVMASMNNVPEDLLSGDYEVN